MKISDAIMLGSTMIKPLAGTHLNQDETQGCAWGMVQKAGGLRLFQEMFIRCHQIKTKLPCGCTGLIIGGGMRLLPAELSDDLIGSIVHLFNDHVMTRKDWTLERLVDWVRSVEPADPEEKQAEKAEVEEVVEV